MMRTLKRVAPEAITIGHRYRQDAGDLTALIASIEKLGMLQPLVVDEQMRLIAGFRRLTAAKQLGMAQVPVYEVRDLDDALARLQAERDENVCRLDMTAMEKAALLEAILPLEREAAQARQAEGRKQGGRARQAQLPKTVSASSPPSDPTESPAAAAVAGEAAPAPAPAMAGEAMTKAAAAVGWSAPTARKALKVKQAIEKNPRNHAKAKQLLDAGNVAGAARALAEADNPRRAPVPGMPLHWKVKAILPVPRPRDMKRALRELKDAVVQHMRRWEWHPEPFAAALEALAREARRALADTPDGGDAAADAPEGERP